MQGFKNALITLTALLALGLMPLAQAEDDNKVLVTVTTGDAQTQAMAMILTSQLVQRGADVRILLCDQAGEMGTTAFEGPTFKGPDANAQQILQKVMKGGAQVDVCALFLPNSDFTQDDLIEGVGAATPQEMGEYMIDEDVRFLSF